MSAAQTFVERRINCPRCNRELFVECVPTTSEPPPFYLFWCALCGETSHVSLPGDPIGVRIPGHSPTRAQVEAAAAQLGTQRYSRWRSCGHTKNVLPAVSDSDLRHCPRCFALYEGERLLNEPKAPGA